jgi:transposase
MATLFGMFPFLKTLNLRKGLQKFYRISTIENRQTFRSGQRIVVLPKRWIVEPTIAWLNRCRRLAKDWECINRKALAFLRLASIRLMLRKLCNPA